MLSKTKYKVRSCLTCNIKDFIYPIACKCCGKLYIFSATDFEERFRIHKSDINTDKIRCAVVSYLLNVCNSATCKTKNLQVQLTEHAFVREGEDIEKVLWEREKNFERISKDMGL